MSLVDTNPFDVLGVPATATRIEVERAGQRLLGLLAIGAASVATYTTPVGARPRTAEGVRAALEALRDPVTRVAAELVAGGACPDSDPWPTLPPWRHAKARLLGGPDGSGGHGEP